MIRTSGKWFNKLLFVFFVAVSGCSRNSVSLISPSGVKYPFIYNSWSQEIKGEIEGRQYSGEFVTNSQTIYSNGTAVVVPGSEGRAILRSEIDTLACEFDFDSKAIIGRCYSLQGVEYGLTGQ